MARSDDEIDIDWVTESASPPSHESSGREPREDLLTVPVPRPEASPLIEIDVGATIQPPMPSPRLVTLPPEELVSVVPEPEPEPELIPIDDRCGRYRLCFELAAGGMATVFLARHEGSVGFERLVALKRIHAHLEREAQFVEMFLDEVRVASRITHPNVCGVTDFGCADGQYFLAMDYLFGEPVSKLRGRLEAEPELRARSVPYVLRMMADAAEGLHAAHELRDDQGYVLNVVHRDIAPQNIFVGFDGSTKVVDFGIAKARGRLTNTATGVLKGHIAYMAPEQFTSKDVDRRADVWALGVVLWELLSGRRLFHRSNDVASTVSAVLSAPIDAVSVASHKLSHALEPVVMRCLSRAPGDRYPTARALGKDLNAIIHRHCEPTGIAEVSEWLAVLFASERAAKERLLLAARRAR